MKNENPSVFNQEKPKTKTRLWIFLGILSVAILGIGAYYMVGSELFQGSINYASPSESTTTLLDGNLEVSEGEVTEDLSVIEGSVTEFKVTGTQKVEFSVYEEEGVKKPKDYGTLERVEVKPYSSEEAVSSLGKASVLTAAAFESSSITPTSEKEESSEKITNCQNMPDSDEVMKYLEEEWLKEMSWSNTSESCDLTFIKEYVESWAECDPDWVIAQKEVSIESTESSDIGAEFAETAGPSHGEYLDGVYTPEEDFDGIDKMLGKKQDLIGAFCFDVSVVEEESEENEESEEGEKYILAEPGETIRFNAGVAGEGVLTISSLGGSEFSENKVVDSIKISIVEEEVEEEEEANDDCPVYGDYTQAMKMWIETGEEDDFVKVMTVSEKLGCENTHVSLTAEVDDVLSLFNTKKVTINRAMAYSKGMDDITSQLNKKSGEYSIEEPTGENVIIAEIEFSGEDADSYVMVYFLEVECSDDEVDVNGVCTEVSGDDDDDDDDDNDDDDDDSSGGGSSHRVSRNNNEEIKTGKVYVEDILALDEFSGLKEVTPVDFIDTDKHEVVTLASLADRESSEPILIGYLIGANRHYIGTRLITREEALKVIMRASAQEVGPAPDYFDDVDDDDWSAPFINTAFQEGRIVGYAGRKFAPLENITRMEVIKMLADIADMPEAPYEMDNPYVDIDDDHWGIDLAKNAFYSGIAVGSVEDGERYLRPDEKINRYEMATMIHNFYAAKVALANQ